MESVTKINQDFFNQIKERFVQLVDENTFSKEVSFAIQHTQKNPTLMKCDTKSILQSVMNVAQTGLSLNPVHKYAYLIPRYVNQQFICVLEPSYIGITKLITDTGSVTNIYAHVIRNGDSFEYSLGTTPDIKHNPSLSNKGEIIGAYAVAVLKNGTKQVEVIDISEIRDIRSRSESFKAYEAGKLKTCTWITDEAEMCRKTVIKRLAKYLPKTESWDKVAKAIELDNYDYAISIDQIHYIEQLLMTSSMAEEKKQFIESMVHTYSASQAREVIKQLEMSQVDRIAAGLNYNQTDIKQKQKSI